MLSLLAMLSAFCAQAMLDVPDSSPTAAASMDENAAVLLMKCLLLLTCGLAAEMPALHRSVGARQPDFQLLRWRRNFSVACIGLLRSGHSCCFQQYSHNRAHPTALARPYPRPGSLRIR